MVLGCKLSKEYESKEENQILYISMIGILMYITPSRPDIVQVVGLVGRFQVGPKETHVQELKIIFRYLKGMLNFGLWYPIGKYFTLTTYTDAYWAGSVDDRKSTNGGVFFMGNNIVPWFSKNKSSISLSTTESKYIAVSSCCTQFLWMKQMLKDIQVEYNQPKSILCDNTSAINISKNLVMHSNTKNIPIKYHFLREQVTK
jgi:hypothetical protein